MALSARNQVRGQVKDVKVGNVMAHIVMQVGDNEIESVITRRSAEEMNLKVGDTVTAIIKSTEVMIQKLQCGSIRMLDPERRHLPNPPGRALLFGHHDSEGAFPFREWLPISFHYEVSLPICERWV